MTRMDKARDALGATGAAVARALGMNAGLTETGSRLTKPGEARGIMPVAGRRSPERGHESVRRVAALASPPVLPA